MYVHVCRTLCRSLQEKMHDFHRSGGIQERFRGVDDKLSKILINAAAVPPPSHEAIPKGVTATNDHLGRSESRNPFMPPGGRMQGSSPGEFESVEMDRQ